MIGKRLLDGMKYTSAAETTPEYLRAKFKRIQRELEQQKQAQANVTPFTNQKRNGGRK